MVFRVRGISVKNRWFRRRAPAVAGGEVNPNVAAYQRRNPRLNLMAGIVAVSLAVLAGGLFWRQVVWGSDYAEQERLQIQRRILQPGARGEILDRKERALVKTQPQYSVVLYVNELRGEFQKKFIELKQEWLKRHAGDDDDAKPTMDRDELLKQAHLDVALSYLATANKLLGRHDGMDEKKFESHFQHNLLLPFTLIRDLTPEEYARFNEQMPIESPMQTYVEAERFYPNKSLAAHTLGYVSLSNTITGDELPGKGLPNSNTFAFRGEYGRDGLELSLDDRLKGIPGGEVWIVGPAGYKFVRVERQIPAKGETVVTSLDLDIQQAAEKAMARFENCAAVALDVQTGEVLAMASKPDFDLNDTVPGISLKTWTDINDSGGWLNRATQGLYPPGSTFKLVDTIAGLRAGILDASTIIDCGPTWPVGNTIFNEHESHSFGPIGVAGALEVSSNVFFYRAGLMIGDQRLAAEARRLGLDKKTGIEVNEARNMIVPDRVWKKAMRPKDGPWTDGETANLAIGQTYLQVTPLQMACLVASIARDQTRTRPTLLHDPEANARQVNDGGQPLGLTPAQRALLLQGMEQCVQGAHGTGQLIKAYVPNIRVAAKTGTAQRFVNGKELVIAWTVAFAPIDHPRIALAVAVESTEKDPNYHGGLQAGPIAGAILQEYFKQYPEAK